MEHEAFLGFAFETFEALHIVAGTQRCSDQRLGFAAGEDGAAVGARQDSGFDPDFANFIEGARVGTARGRVVVDDVVLRAARAGELHRRRARRDADSD